jgi:hypothetical protein
MKAYMVHPGILPFDPGCVLVYAISRGKAKSRVMQSGPFMFPLYTDLRAVRKPIYDKFWEYMTDDIIETNSELPCFVPAFFRE